jgi:phosphoglycolate phosphatase-like HAD superfamily hydrolase
MLQIPNTKQPHNDRENDETPLFIFDFDGVFHTSHTEYEIYITAAIMAVVAHTGLTPEEARALCAKSWEEHRDVMTLVVEHPQCKTDYDTIYSHYNFILHDPLQPKILPGLRSAFNSLHRHGHVAILSHSPTRYVQQVGTRFGLSPYILMHNTYGIDRVSRRYKHESGDAVLQICDELRVHPSKATLIEDTAANLAFAKAAGLSTVHINWGKVDTSDYIDTAVIKTMDAVNYLRFRYPKPLSHCAK